MGVQTSELPQDFLPLLDELNNIVKASGAPLEGNLFYYHKEQNASRNTVYDHFHAKRKNFASACADSSVMLEIGMNAGHSALLALSRGVEYHGIDVALHAYVKPAAAFLKEKFGERFHFYAGDSRVAVPRLALEHPRLRFDLVHIDGHHAPEFFKKDFDNSLPLTLKGGWVLIDDTDMKEIRAFYDELIATGTLLAEAPPGWDKDCTKHGIGRVPLASQLNYLNTTVFVPLSSTRCSMW